MVRYGPSLRVRAWYGTVQYDLERFGTMVRYGPSLRVRAWYGTVQYDLERFGTMVRYGPSLRVRAKGWRNETPPRIMIGSVIELLPTAAPGLPGPKASGGSSRSGVTPERSGIGAIEPSRLASLSAYCCPSPVIARRPRCLGSVGGRVRSILAKTTTGTTVFRGVFTTEPRSRHYTCSLVQMRSIG
jgi:hypothetical protein